MVSSVNTGVRLGIFISLTDADLAYGLRSLLQATGFSLDPTGVEVLVAREAEGISVTIPQQNSRALLKSSASSEEIAAEVARLARLREEPSNRGCPALIGESASMSTARREIMECARSESNVLITGETGTGKELVAQLIHQNSTRRNRPMVAINCAAIPDSLIESELFGYERGAFTGAVIANEGKLKQADGGTVFLDEIGDLSPFAQAKLLRVLETREVQRLGGRGVVKADVRVIAATNRDLEDAPASPAAPFRTDLFFRLSVIQIALPPLRDRMEDVFPLAQQFFDEFRVKFACKVASIGPHMKSLLLRHSWPGNVRELRNVIEAAFVNHPSAGAELLEMPARLIRRFEARVDAAPAQHGSGEAEHVLAALESTNWNKAEAARLLRWSRMTLYRKMAKYQLVKSARPSFRHADTGT